MASYLKPCQKCGNPVRSMTPWLTAPLCPPCKEKLEARAAKPKQRAEATPRSRSPRRSVAKVSAKRK